MTKPLSIARYVSSLACIADWDLPMGLYRYASSLSLLQVPLQFSGEEMYGRYLDLHEFFNSFVNIIGKKGSMDAAEAGAAASDADQATLKPAEDYITYVQQFTHFNRIPRALKFQKAYMQYVESLLRYLISFHERTQPLKSAVKLMEEVEDDFEKNWEAGELLGWEDRAEGPLPDDTDLVIDVDAFDSPEELLELGMQPVSTLQSATTI
jgi:splicing factor 3A subunit 3